LMMPATMKVRALVSLITLNSVHTCVCKWVAVSRERGDEPHDTGRACKTLLSSSCYETRRTSVCPLPAALTAATACHATP
jgi:hypothetical protein